MLKARFKKHILKFNFPGGTSRGVLLEKPSWYLQLEDDWGNIGIGEISLIPGLSLDDASGMDQLLESICLNPEVQLSDYKNRFQDLPALVFGIECALKSLKNNSPYLLYDSPFVKGDDSISINGLIWMGDIPKMNEQIEKKLEQGFQCLKMKIGALNFDEEVNVLKSIRKRFSKGVLELRVDANGAFSPDDAMKKLEELSKLDLHSIEQPIKAGQYEQMHRLCAETPLPIALDEELIGLKTSEQKREAITAINPQYIILKPSLIGGFESSEEWISLANEYNVGWWVTSALEGNIGLNAIAQWTYTLNPKIPQGLGTGQVFSNNIDSPLWLKTDQLYYNPNSVWEYPFDKE